MSARQTSRRRLLFAGLALLAFVLVLSLSLQTGRQTLNQQQSSANLTSSCAASASPTLGTVALHVGVNSPGLLCVRFYYYNRTAPITFDPLKRLYIEGWHGQVPNGVGYSIDVTGNFTISAKPATLTIGGPSNESEGALVVYSIAGKTGTDGTYNLNLGWIGPRFLNCGHEFDIIVGKGTPDYSFNAGCITSLTWSSFPYPEGYVVAEVVEMTNAS